MVVRGISFRSLELLHADTQPKLVIVDVNYIYVRDKSYSLWFSLWWNINCIVLTVIILLMTCTVRISHCFVIWCWKGQGLSYQCVTRLNILFKISPKSAEFHTVNFGSPHYLFIITMSRKNGARISYCCVLTFVIRTRVCEGGRGGRKLWGVLCKGYCVVT